MTALLLLISGGVLVLYGHLCISENTAGSKSDGLVVGLFGYALVAISILFVVLK